MAAAHHRPHRPAEERRAAPVRLGHRQPHHLALHRPHRNRHLLGQPRQQPAAAPRRQHRLPALHERAVGQLHAHRPATAHHQPPGGGPAPDHSGPLARGHQRRGEPPRIDLVVPVDPQTAPDPRRQHRLQPPATPGPTATPTPAPTGAATRATPADTPGRRRPAPPPACRSAGTPAPARSPPPAPPRRPDSARPTPGSAPAAAPRRSAARSRPPASPPRPEPRRRPEPGPPRSPSAPAGPPATP